MKFSIGVDEAGRGALAGPVCVGAVLYPVDFDWHEAFSLVTKRGEVQLRDSKKLSETQRETLFEYITHHNRLRYAAGFVDAQTIDTIGIVPATHTAAAEAINALNTSPDEAHVLLDAGLRAPDVWGQESFIRGDENIPAIAFASIIAKVSRDRFMDELAPHYGAYDLGRHKGYGTLVHRTAIAREGLSDIHRASFCRGLLVGRKSV